MLNKRATFFVTTILLLLVLLLIGLQQDFFLQKTHQPSPYVLDEPDLFYKMAQPSFNPLSEEGIFLGRHLFYDPILSLDSTISCANCHQQKLAFTDGRAFSEGIEGHLGKRSSPSLANIGYHYKGLFWDGRSISLEAQAIHPVIDTLEMGNTWEEVENRLKKHPLYPKLFKDAFGIKRKEIKKEWVAKALSQFQRTLISTDSPYDQMVAGKRKFTEQEWRGMTIFFDASEELSFSECGHCHTDPLFTHIGFENNGIDPDLINRDKGKGAISGKIFEEGQFKVPTLRNIAVTAPYMHDGRFKTLEEVLEHYNSGGHPSPNVSPNVRPLNLSEQDKKDLIAFLNTLTDSTFISNEAYSSPF